MNDGKKILGYVVKYSGAGACYVEHDTVTGSNFVTQKRPQPISRPDALRRLAAYSDKNSNGEDFYVTPVFHEPSPIEKASAELGSLLQSLCTRNGLNLGLTQEQINKQIEQELKDLQTIVK